MNAQTDRWYLMYRTLDWNCKYFSVSISAFSNWLLKNRFKICCASCRLMSWSFSCEMKRNREALFLRCVEFKPLWSANGWWLPSAWSTGLFWLNCFMFIWLFISLCKLVADDFQIFFWRRNLFLVCNCPSGGYEWSNGFFRLEIYFLLTEKKSR